MEFRLFTDADYPIVESWWKDWGWPPVHQSSLSETGVIVSNGGLDIAAVWLYKTDSDMALIEWFIANKKAPRELRKGCIEGLSDEVARLAKEFGYLTMTCCISNPSLINKLESTGFGFKTGGMTTMTRIL
jgi:hypothetical protein